MLSLGHGLKLLSAARPRRNSRDRVCLSIQTSKRGKTRRCFCNSRAGGTTMAEEEEMMMSGGHSEMSSASHKRFPLDLRAEKDVSCSRRDSDGRFVNPWSTWDFPSYSKFFRFFLMDKNNSSVPSSKEVLDHELPIMEPFFVQRPDDCGKASLRVTWLGHATVLVELDGLVILTDPMFSQRASPVAFMGPKRYRDPPCTVEQIPRLDAVVISHNHYDHLDIASVLSLNSRFGSNLRWFVPLGLAGWMRNSGCENVVELDWWVGSCIPGHDEVAFFCTPAQHWCKRSALDENKALWSSWTIVGPNRRFFFAGDTGYCSVFQEIGRQFGPFDLAAIPIGAYLPRNIMKSQHVDPEEAVQIHKDVQAKSSVAIHWGTFALAHEHYLDPPIRLCEAMVHHMLNPERFFTLRHGESRVLNHEDMLS